MVVLQELSIDIADRDPTDNAGGIPYKLLAEACIPSINVDDLGSIFEEHRVCKNLSVWQHSNSVSEQLYVIPHKIRLNWKYYRYLFDNIHADTK